jgi:hypothetical protein
MLGPLDSALLQETARQHKELPPELSHLILFYTAGTLVKEAVPTHVMFAETFGIWGRNDRTKAYHEMIAQEWQPYLSGTRDFATTVSALVGRLD